MGRLTIRKKTNRRKLKVPYDAELNELKEWQSNMYNPGHYIGTGKVPYPMKNLAKRRELKWAYLLSLLIPLGIGLIFMDLVWFQVIPAVLVIAVLLFIIWDSRRVIKKKYRNKR
ncbi:MAG: hypothetical protein K0Q65_2910 [Clostridia bacterium]|nr:hypothetical protein [Clostridia bacterium]